jgi:hypothetical protein
LQTGGCRAGSPRFLLLNAVGALFGSRIRQKAVDWTSIWSVLITMAYPAKSCASAASLIQKDRGSLPAHYDRANWRGTDNILSHYDNSESVSHEGDMAKTKPGKVIVLRPVAQTGRKPNAEYRTREYLTETEMTKLLAALKANRWGHRDWLIGLLIYRHGLRVSELCDLR